MGLKSTSRLMWAWAAALLLVVTVLYVPLVREQLAVSGDFHYHTEQAQLFLEGGMDAVRVSHFLYFLPIALLVQLTGLPLGEAAVLVGTGYYALTALVVWGVLLAALGDKATWWQHALIFATAVLFTSVSPLALSPFSSREVLLWQGYFSPSSHHNPTTTAVRPFTVLTLMAGLLVFGHMPQSQRARVLQGLGAALLVAASIAAKPNWMLAFLPALVAYALWHIVRKQPVRVWLLVFAFALPTLAMLFWQYTFMFGKGFTTSNVIAPFKVMLYYTLSYRLLALALLGSLAFPLATLLLYPRWLRASRLWLLSWLTLAVSLAQAYLLAQEERFFGDGNWTWGAHLAVFTLFVVATALLIRETRQHPPQTRAARARLVLVLGVLVAHCVVGVAWYLANIVCPVGKLCA